MTENVKTAKIHGVEQGERALIWSDYDRIRRDCKDYQVMHGNTTSTIISVINISVMVVIGIINHHTLQTTFSVQIGVQIRTRKLVSGYFRSRISWLWSKGDPIKCRALLPSLGTTMFLALQTFSQSKIGPGVSKPN